MVYDKLVRDKIPDIIMESGKYCKIRKVNGNEFSHYIYEKIKEELNEFKSAYEKKSCKEMIDELCDLITITLKYVRENSESDKMKCMCLYNLMEQAKRKIEKNGEFEEGYVLLETEDK